MILKNVVACLAVLAFVTGSTCAMAKNVDNQQKVEKQQKKKKRYMTDDEKAKAELQDTKGIAGDKDFYERWFEEW